MNINTATLLNLLSPKLDISAKHKIESLSVDNKIDIKTLLQDKSIRNIFDDLLKDLNVGIKNKQQITKLLQNSKHLFDFKPLNNNIEKIITQIEQDPKTQQKFTKELNILKQFKVDIKNIDTTQLKTNLKNNGIFLESKLLNNDKDITQDIKGILHKISDHIDNKTIDKTLDQIGYYQLLSFSNNSNYHPLPFRWDNMEDGEIEFVNDTKTNSCHISLLLKDYGEFNSMLILDKDKNLTINLNIEQDELKTKIQNNIQQLRKQLNSLNLNLSGINISSLNKQPSYEQKAYQANEKLNLSLEVLA